MLELNQLHDCQRVRYGQYTNPLKWLGREGLRFHRGFQRSPCRLLHYTPMKMVSAEEIASPTYCARGNRSTRLSYALIKWLYGLVTIQHRV